MADVADNKRKYLAIILICIMLIIFVFAIATTIVILFNRNDSQNNDEQNNVVEEEIAKEDSEENDIITVIIDQEPESEENNEGGNVDENENQTDTNDESGIYYIKVNNQANVVTVYKADSNGEYTIPIKAMLCSVGTYTPTSGVYTISDKYTWRLLQGNVYGQYAVRITGHILFHSVPYEKKSNDSLEWWEYDKLGTSASLGCVRLTVEDAKWIYDYCEAGTQVEFYSDSDPGPLGTPIAKKISSYSDELRNWDPTDPDPSNPWLTYVETIEEDVETVDNTSEIEENTVEKTTK